MRLLLFILSLFLSCTFKVQTTDTEEEFDMSKLSGRWYPFLLASTYKGWERKDFGALLYEIKVTIHYLIINFSIREREECYTSTMVAYRVETNKYKFKYPGRHEFHVEDVDPEDYLLISTTNQFDEMLLGVELYSRHKDGTLNEMIKDRFEQICELYGLTNENIINLTTTDRCFLNKK